MAKYHGSNSRFYVSTSGSANAVPITGITEWSIDMKTDRVEMTSMGDSNKVYVQGLPDISGTFSGHWDDTDTTLFTARSSSDGCKIYCYPTKDATAKVASGPAWLDLSVKTGSNGGVDFSGTFAAKSAWTISL